MPLIPYFLTLIVCLSHTCVVSFICYWPIAISSYDKCSELSQFIYIYYISDMPLLQITIKIMLFLCRTHKQLTEGSNHFMMLTVSVKG